MGRLFFYLPRPLRLIAAKDMRTFLRDAQQWSQLAILFGLLVLYLTNMPTLRLEFSAVGWTLVIPFLNLCAVSLILATFTCRFVFPLMTLEGQKLWLVGVAPLSRGRILIAKFAFAMTVTVAVAMGAMVTAVYMLDLHPAWGAIHLLVTLSICVGLCGCSVGLGARLPMFGQTNVARIANGLGGTINLLASLALVTVVLTAVGAATARTRYSSQWEWPGSTEIALCGSAIAGGVILGVIPMIVGSRHFHRIDV